MRMVHMNSRIMNTVAVSGLNKKRTRRMKSTERKTGVTITTSIESRATKLCILHDKQYD